MHNYTRKAFTLCSSCLSVSSLSINCSKIKEKMENEYIAFFIKISFFFSGTKLLYGPLSSFNDHKTIEKNAPKPYC